MASDSAKTAHPVLNSTLFFDFKDNSPISSTLTWRTLAMTCRILPLPPAHFPLNRKLMHRSRTIDAEDLGVKIPHIDDGPHRGKKRRNPLGLADDIRFDFIRKSHQF